MTTVEAVREFLAAHPSVRIVGSDRHAAYRLPSQATATLRVGLVGVTEFSPDDQVVSVRAGTPVAELQAALAERGQCLPHTEARGTVGGQLSLNLPHRLEGPCGSWREWTLGATVVLGDGTVARSGSRAVKNVAGYDVHRLLVGARGALGVVVEVVLRTYPLRSLPPFEPAPALEGSVWIQRTLRTDFEAARAAPGLGYEDEATCTLWRQLSPDASLPRYPEDWVVRSGCGPANLDPVGPADLIRRAKDQFDPLGKLNPGELGVC